MRHVGAGWVQLGTGTRCAASSCNSVTGAGLRTWGRNWAPEPEVLWIVWIVAPTQNLENGARLGGDEPGIDRVRGFVLSKNEDQVPGWIADLSAVIMYDLDENQVPVEANKRGRCTYTTKPKTDRG